MVNRFFIFIYLIDNKVRLRMLYDLIDKLIKINYRYMYLIV